MKRVGEVFEENRRTDRSTLNAFRDVKEIKNDREDGRLQVE